MRPYRDPRLPPSYAHLAPTVAARIPANRIRHAIERLSDSLQAREDLLGEMTDRIAAAERAARARRLGR
jgi:hypothetical protein